MTGPVDSFGAPWAGRSLTPQPFAGDDGAADPELSRALAVHAGDPARPGHDGQAAVSATAREVAVLAAVAAARLLVAVRAVVGEDHPLPTHDRGDAGADLGLALLTGRDGRRALPAFTAVGAIAAWDADARPVPVEAARAAQAAVAEGCDAMVLDVAGPVPFVVRRAPLWALAQGRAWVPAAQDDEVRAAVEQAVGGLPQVRGVRCEAAERCDLVVVLGVETGLTSEQLQELVGGVRSALAAQDVVAERVDSLELTVLPA